ncbi:MAG: hypothetical protein JO331_13645 [Verrucomicrobia bacterium]|nr:hypothetical protein [Verrucomicrobiota bacterium]
MNWLFWVQVVTPQPPDSASNTNQYLSTVPTRNGTARKVSFYPTGSIANTKNEWDGSLKTPIPPFALTASPPLVFNLLN